MTAEEIEAALAAAVSDPQSVSTDAGTVSMPSMYNQLLLLKYLREREAQESGNNRPKFSRIVNGNSRGL